MSGEESAYGSKNYVVEVLKGVVVALITSLALILVAAFVIKIFNIDSKYIPLINQIIKSLSILISALICFKLTQNGWLRGLVLGVSYILFAFIVFSLLDGGFSFGFSLISDLLFGGISGIISGIISVNIRK